MPDGSISEHDQEKISLQSTIQKTANSTMIRKPCYARTGNFGRRLPDWRSVNADTKSLTAYMLKMIAAYSGRTHKK